MINKVHNGDCLEVLKTLPDNCVDSVVTDKHICPVCRKEFEKKVYKKCQAVYCSQKCAYRGRSLGITKRKIKKPYNCYRKPKKICLTCNNKFIYKTKKQKYCSRKCFEVAHKQNMIGDKNPAYKNGSSYNKRCWRGNDWDTLRKEIYKRDNFICQDCGIKCVAKMKKNNGYNIIQCHHIENYKIKKNNNKNNLITLCLMCHLKRHNQKGKMGVS